jgi:hypothetical protein
MNGADSFVRPVYRFPQVSNAYSSDSIRMP